MAKEQVFADGIRCFNKRENAPAFVLGSVCITLNDLIKFCKEHPEYLKEYKGEKQLILNMQISQKGNLVAIVDTYQKEQTGIGNNSSDLPF